MKNIFEKKYKNEGINSQRKYPNTELIAFLGRNGLLNAPLNQKNKTKVLEIGCGSGANLWMLAQEGFSVYGMDSSPTGLEYCEQMLEKKLLSSDLKEGDFLNLPYEDNFFDLIVDVVSLQHINLDDHKKAFSEVYRCLKPGGLFFSYHVGFNSTPMRMISVPYGVALSLNFEAKIIDENTIDFKGNVPLADNGPMCFLNCGYASNLLQIANFTDIAIDSVIRTYGNGNQQIEYLVIEAKK